MRKSGPSKLDKSKYKINLSCFARDKSGAGHECIADPEHIEKGLPHLCCCKDPFWDDEETLKYG